MSGMMKGTHPNPRNHSAHTSTPRATTTSGCKTIPSRDRQGAVAAGGQSFNGATPQCTRALPSRDRQGAGRIPPQACSPTHTPQVVVRTATVRERPPRAIPPHACLTPAHQAVVVVVVRTATVRDYQCPGRPQHSMKTHGVGGRLICPQRKQPLNSPNNFISGQIGLSPLIAQTSRSSKWSASSTERPPRAITRRASAGLPQ